MDVSYASELVEKVILGEMRRREALGDRGLTKLYHRRAEPFYEHGEEERAEMFNRLHAEFFAKLGFDKMMREILAEFPDLDKVGRMSVIEAETEEEADLAVGEGEPKMILIKLQPESFLDQGRLGRILRHELMHVSDMLDDSFGYRIERLGASISEEIIVRDKYRLLWDIYIDSRLARRGAVGQEAKDLRFAEFERVYQKIPEEHRKRVFEVLWNTEKMAHDELLQFAREPRKLLERAGIAYKKTVLLPGMICPLCKFPTYNWFEKIETSVEPEVIDMIKKDFPPWEEIQGACERCIEVYKARAAEKQFLKN